MIQSKQDYLKQLSKQLGTHPEKKQIINEYDVHISEMMHEITTEEYMKVVVDRLGTPEEIADIWKEELSVTPNKTKWLFVLVNIVLFTSGAILTAVYNVFEWNMVEMVWSHLTDIPALIMMIYMLFWALLGYEIGKEFGHGGRTLLKKTFILSLIPNLTLMSLTVFQLIPYEWFQPLLNTKFIIACIVATGFLYPICLVGYKWGKKVALS
ncbi:HAAS signaling domain-containing protein [Salinibacillus xinjiangensis]|uniref:DUF1700 domain-containing protein n=1 Tax=Salinibacillus xinjiangensis TaxID=1229268 RepID=A0A6G1X917_9BACI|nr:hypothetical protein [Salinibacillus xinjiangensis]MRG87298.1 hypothetical protein [Salinibacillus xinjiangensis]